MSATGPDEPTGPDPGQVPAPRQVPDPGRSRGTGQLGRGPGAGDQGIWLGAPFRAGRQRHGSPPRGLHSWRPDPRSDDRPAGDQRRAHVRLHWLAAVPEALLVPRVRRCGLRHHHDLADLGRDRELTSGRHPFQRAPVHLRPPCAPMSRRRPRRLRLCLGVFHLAERHLERRCLHRDRLCLRGDGACRVLVRVALNALGQARWLRHDRPLRCPGFHAATRRRST